MSDNVNSGFRTVRGYQLANQQEGKLTPALEDYLEMTYRLCAQNDHARIGKLSQLLNVKPSSASKMISKLANLGYLKYVRYEIIQLTDSGRKLGEYLLKRHKTVETFLRLIGSANALKEAELIEHMLSASTVAALDTLNVFFSFDTEAAQRYIAFKEAGLK